ncbi:Xaa-Pro aminopeptidase 1 [Clavibacter michiganensis subsp. michiganensis]|nr:Xaa-Pro aminopeptidase 1 [Clavibacter michiganensis subsp. michiganensis]
MAGGWITPDRTPTTVPGAVEAAAAHRDRLSAAMPGVTLAVVSGYAPTRNDDCRYAFRADSDFVWLTGVQIEGAVLVMHAVPGGHDAVLHVPAPAHPGDPRFYSDADHGELWVGPAPAHADWHRVLRIPVRDPGRLAPDLAGVRDVRRAGAVTGVPSALADVPRDAALVAALGELRVIKDAWEIEELRRAVDDTVEGFAEVVRAMPRARAHGGERWLQGTFDRHARTVGNGPGYATIVGGGGHATTLHWVRCDGPLRDGELVLLDMGVEARSLYTADVTRTIPVDGTFTPSSGSCTTSWSAATARASRPSRPVGRSSTSTTRPWRSSPRGCTTWGSCRSRSTRRSRPPGSTTGAGWCAASGTTSGSTCTTARAPGSPATTARSSRAWC